MMMYFLLLLCVIICYGMTLNDIQAEKGYLNRDKTDAIKGIFILMILFTHFWLFVTYTDFGDILQKRILSFFGQGVVSMFLFYSGYGVTEAIKSKGERYIKLIPKKRILTTFVRFNCAVVVYVGLYYYMFGKIDWHEVLLSTVAWSQYYGNPSWYIFAIIVFYSLSYFISMVCDLDKKKLYLFLMFTTIGLYCLGVYLLKKPGHWFDTAWCYWIGVAWSIYKEKIEECLLGGANGIGLYL